VGQGSPVTAVRPPLLTPAMLGIAAGAILVPLNSTMLAVALPSVMTTFAVRPDEVASLVTLYLGAVTVALSDGTSLTADLVIVNVGVRPASTLALEAGLVLGPTGAIRVV